MVEVNGRKKRTRSELSKILGLTALDLTDLSDRPASQSFCSIDSRSVSKLQKALKIKLFQIFFLDLKPERPG